MSGYICELYGRSASEVNEDILSKWSTRKCPFSGDACSKRRHDNTPAGVCAVRQSSSETPIICCPQRLYADNYELLREVAIDAFSLTREEQQSLQLVAGEPAAKQIAISFPGKVTVCVFGHRWGHELPLPVPSSFKSTCSIDWILVLLNSLTGAPESFCAAEVQTVDTTGSHAAAASALTERGVLECGDFGINWANVRKRIFTQIVYKGQVLERETRCTSGLYYIVPKPVFDNNFTSLGGERLLPRFPKRPGTITFFVYDYDPDTKFSSSCVRPLKHIESYTTGIHQLQQAFTNNLPDEGDLYYKAIRKAMGLL